MTDKVKKLAPQIWQAVQKANRILVNCHRSPDPDSLCSALAVNHVLTKIGKTVTIISGDSPIPQTLSALPGFSLIQQKKYAEIDPTQFDLFLVLDTSTPDQISKAAKVIFPPNMQTVKIDHHQNQSDFANINLVDTSYPATCQILSDLFTLWGVEIPPEAAGCMLVGIYTDTGGFKYPPSNSDTLLVASDLAKIYPDYFRLIYEIENSNDPGVLKLLVLALNSIEHYFGGKVAIASLTYEVLSQNNIQKEFTKTAEIPNLLKSVPGWLIGVSFLEFDKGTVELSFRRREFEGPDLSKVAIALGGGGHKSAAGASISLPFAQAKQFLLEALAKAYPELGTP